MTPVLAIALVLVGNGVESGPRPGGRPGPYSFLIVTGPQRGQPTCYVCDAADKPMAIVFARSLTEPLGRLSARLDSALADRVDLRAWLTVLGREVELAGPLVEWGRRQAIRQLPLGVFESDDGPPVYRLHRDAEVTVVLAVKRKVVKSFAFRPGELTDGAVDELLAAVRELGKTSEP